MDVREIMTTPAGATSDTLHVTVRDTGPSGTTLRTAASDIAITIAP